MFEEQNLILLFFVHVCVLPKGLFAYRFTSPGVYYYSSGYIDTGNRKTLQGVVTVMPLEDSTVGLQVFVTGIEASMNKGTTVTL